MNNPYFNRIKIAKCDITRLEVEAIVNAANSNLLGGSGVEGLAIVRDMWLTGFDVPNSYYVYRQTYAR